MGCVGVHRAWCAYGSVPARRRVGVAVVNELEATRQRERRSRCPLALCGQCPGGQKCACAIASAAVDGSKSGMVPGAAETSGGAR